MSWKEDLEKLKPRLIELDPKTVAVALLMIISKEEHESREKKLKEIFEKNNIAYETYKKEVEKFAKESD